MNLNWICLLITTFVASTDIIKMINLERNLYKLKPIIYDNDLEDDLNLYASTFGADIINEEILDYATFDKFKKQGYRFISKGEYHNSMRNNIKYRLRQRKCFNERKCSDTKFNNFVSCYDTGGNREDDCRHLWYGSYIIQSLKSIACIDLKKENRYYCYGSTDKLLTDNPLKN